jgi:hypothetical protein
MQLPVLFRHELESGVVARTKEYVIKTYHLLVDVEEDVKAFIDHGWRIIAEGERALELFKDKSKSDNDKKTESGKTEEPKTDAQADNNTATDNTKKAATSKGKNAAK